MTSVEDRVHAAMSAAADANLAARDIRSAPPLRLPPGPAADDRRRPAPRRWVRSAAPLAAAAAVIALAISLVLVKGAQNDGVVPLRPTASASPAVSVGPGRLIRRLPLHINDPEFSRALIEEFLSLSPALTKVPS